MIFCSNEHGGTYSGASRRIQFLVDELPRWQWEAEAKSHIRTGMRVPRGYCGSADRWPLGAKTVAASNDGSSGITAIASKHYAVVEPDSFRLRGCG